MQDDHYEEPIAPMTEEPEEEDRNLSYEETLAYSQRLRRKVVRAYTKGGKIPEDPKEVDVILRTLKDMDGTAINDRKNNIDQANADSSKEVASAMREFVGMQMNQNPFERNADGSIDRDETGGVLPEARKERLGDHKLVDGEGEIGVIAETSTSFMKRMEAERDQQYREEEDT